MGCPRSDARIGVTIPLGPLVAGEDASGPGEEMRSLLVRAHAAPLASYEAFGGGRRRHLRLHVRGLKCWLAAITVFLGVAAFSRSHQGPLWHSGWWSIAGLAADIPQRELLEQHCTDNPVGWVSAAGTTCQEYAAHHLCSKTGGYGTAWDPEAYGTFARWSRGGRTPLTACCSCGGGVWKEVPAHRQEKRKRGSIWYDSADADMDQSMSRSIIMSSTTTAVATTTATTHTTSQTETSTKTQTKTHTTTTFTVLPAVTAATHAATLGTTRTAGLTKAQMIAVHGRHASRTAGLPGILTPFDPAAKRMTSQTTYTTSCTAATPEVQPMSPMDAPVMMSTQQSTVTGTTTSRTTGHTLSRTIMRSSTSTESRPSTLQHQEEKLLAIVPSGQAEPPHGDCSWDWENCSQSRCCRGVGMQCYAKTKSWSACKPSCRPGRDAYDVDEKFWSCAPLGPRSPTVGGDETCYPGRVGAEFWNAKEFHHDFAQSDDTCSARCQEKAGCVGWAWHKGQCFLTPSVDRTGPAAPPCRISSNDLPNECTASGHECSTTRCCIAMGEQCYTKDKSYASCKLNCKKGDWNCEKLGPRFCPACRPLLRSKPSIVVATWERDLCKANLLAKSITRRDSNNHLGDFYLLWVSTQTPYKYQFELDQIKDEISKTRAFHLLDFSAQVASPSPACLIWTVGGESCVSPFLGWYAQMTLKLKIAALMPSDFYLILDSKNAFFNDVEEDTFFTSCNQARVEAEYPLHAMPMPHKTWYERAAKALGIQVSGDQQFPTSITPAVLNKKTVLDLLAKLNEGTNPYQFCDGPLCNLFAMGATEFTLYNMFALTRGDAECNYDLRKSPDERPLGIALWRVDPHVNVEKCEEVATGSIAPVTFGIQSQAFGIIDNTSGLSSEDRRMLWGILQICVTKAYRHTGLHDNSMDDMSFTKCVS